LFLPTGTAQNKQKSLHMQVASDTEQNPWVSVRIRTQVAPNQSASQTPCSQNYVNHFKGFSQSLLCYTSLTDKFDMRMSNSVESTSIKQKKTREVTLILSRVQLASKTSVFSCYSGGFRPVLETGGAPRGTPPIFFPPHLTSQFTPPLFPGLKGE
jgi:hypothetical protein